VTASLGADPAPAQEFVANTSPIPHSLLRRGIRRVSGGRAARRTTSSLFGGPAAVFLLALAAYPLLEMVRMSLSDVQIGNLLREWPFVGTANFAALFSNSDFWSAFGTTVGFAGAVLVLSLVGGLVAAFLIRSNSRTAQFAQALMVLVWAIPPVVNGTLWKFLFSGEGAINGALRAVGVGQPILFLADPTLALWSVAFVTSWVTVPFVAIVLKSGLLDIPVDVVEAARIDGASPGQVTRYVTLPLLRPVLIVTTVLIAIYAFRSFDYIYVMTLGGPGTATTTLPFLGYKSSLKLFLFSQGAAIGVVALLMIVVLATVYARTARAEAAAR
jgi:multiple sugar transport system permease protein